MNDQTLPNLTLNGLPFVSWSTCSLFGLLFLGASNCQINLLDSKLKAGIYGKARPIRIPLVEKFHDAFAFDIASGVSWLTIKKRLSTIRRFYAWADRQNIDLTIENVQEQFHYWTDTLRHEDRTNKQRSERWTYKLACLLARIIQSALDLETGLLYKAKIKRSRRRKVTTKSEKQNLSDAFKMGELLTNITMALNIEAVKDNLPITIPITNGNDLKEWCGTMGKQRSSEFSWNRRHSILNLRIEAELLTFIAQTGMNLAQAYKLKVGKFTYKSDSGGYSVRRIYKDRAKGEVEFHIYSEYRTHFENYLRWRLHFYGNDQEELLFPVRCPRYGAAKEAPTFTRIRKRCNLLGIRFVGARELRSTRANWLLRRSQDSTITAEMNQHTEATLLRDYVRPNHQIAIIEVSRFMHEIDPILTPPGPGACIKNEPTPTISMDQHAPKPDCSSPAGCLFCVNQRDLKSFDHIWSLISYRHLKSLELITYKVPNNEYNPAAAVIEEITRRCNTYKSTDQQIDVWIQEATARIEEEEYHPLWDIFIQLIGIFHAQH